MTPASYWKQVREAEAKATPGPWQARIDWFDCAGEGIEVHVEGAGVDLCFRSFPVPDTTFGHGDDEAPWTEEDAAKKSAAEKKALASQEMDDARFIALSREAMGLALARIEELEAALTRAADDLESAVSYVPEYFQDKWEMADDVKAARAALGVK